MFNKRNREFWANWHSWEHLLSFATRYDWTPQGTEYHARWDDEDPTEWERGRKRWEGWYFCNDYQIVTAVDASAMADAVARGLAVLPDQEPSEITEAEKANQSHENAEIRLFASVRGKAYLRDFIEFAREGAFKIC